jgi:hypothetical protein
MRSYLFVVSLEMVLVAESVMFFFSTAVSLLWVTLSCCCDCPHDAIVPSSARQRHIFTYFMLHQFSRKYYHAH